MEDSQQFSGPRTTAQSSAEGRLKVDAGSSKKKKDIMKKAVSRYTKSAC